MNITEITNQNKSWALLSGIDLSVDTIYKSLIPAMNTIISTNSSYRSSQIMHTVDNFEIQINRLINYDFSNYPNPDDMTKFKNKCTKMSTNIQYLKSKLP